jgi:hypothetical protein
MDLSNLSSELEPLKACANVHNINNAIEAAVPLIQPRSKYAIWWTKELSEQRRYLLKLKRILRTHQNDQTLAIKCRKPRREWQASVRVAKHCYWIDKLETTDRKNVWKTIATRQTHRKPLPPISGQTDFQSKADALRLGLFSNISNPPDIPEGFVTSTANLTAQFNPVTKEEINNTLKTLKNVLCPRRW